MPQQQPGRAGPPEPTSDGRVQRIQNTTRSMIPGAGGADHSECSKCKVGFGAFVRCNVRVLAPGQPALEVALCPGCRTSWEDAAQVALGDALRAFLA